MRTLLILVTIAFLHGLWSCGGGAGSKSTEVDSLNTELQIKDSIINEVFSTLNDITTNLNVIKTRENIITSAVNNNEIRQEPTAQIREDIMAIDELLQQNREMISRLRGDAEALRKANIRITSLESLIIEMTAQVEEKNGEIARLKDEVGKLYAEVGELGGQVVELSTQVSGLTDDNTLLKEEVETKGQLLNTAYYIVGSRKELTDQGIVYKSGVIGRTLKVNESRSLDAFTRVDVRNFDRVIVSRKNVEMVTTHPEGSYTWIMDDKGVYGSLKITDPVKFWEYSKVLVIAYK